MTKLRTIAYALIGLLFVSPAFAASTYTTCTRLENPTPGDPATTNVWGTIENTGRSLSDTAIAGTTTVNVGGASNVILTASNGAADQARSAHFIFTGALTGNVVVLFPQNGCETFSAKNATSGAFTLSVGVNNGSGVPAGVTQAITSGQTGLFVAGGTDVNVRISAGGLNAAQAGANSNITSLSGLTTPLSVPQGGTGANTLTSHGFVIGEGASAVGVTTAPTAGQIPVGQAGADPAPKSMSGDVTIDNNAVSTIGAGKVTSGKVAAGVAVANLGYTPLNPANNLSDVGNAATARTNLGITTGGTAVQGIFFTVSGGVATPVSSFGSVTVSRTSQGLYSFTLGATALNMGYFTAQSGVDGSGLNVDVSGPNSTMAANGTYTITFKNNSTGNLDDPTRALVLFY